MKLPLIAGAACLVALSACAGITDRTGISAEQQMTCAQAVISAFGDAAYADLTNAQKAQLAAAQCVVLPDSTVVEAGSGDVVAAPAE